MKQEWKLRLANESDIAAFENLITLSVRGLQADYYSAAQMDAALGSVFGVDRQLRARKELNRRSGPATAGCQPQKR